MMRGDRGSVAVTVAVLLPLLLTTVSGVIQLGAVRILAARVASAADLATLAATDDQDDLQLIGAGRLQLTLDAAAVARKYFALNLSSIGAHLATTPDEAAGQADVAVFNVVPAVDPLTGWRYERPTVRLVAAVPVRTVSFGLLLPAVTTVTVRSASSPR
jgi:hypothetical protein